MRANERQRDVRRWGPGARSPRAVMSDDYFRVDDLRVSFTVKDGWRRRGEVRAVDGVSLSVAQGESLGLVGESGCGKSTLAYAMVHLHPFTGSMSLAGADVSSLAGRRLTAYRRQVQMVFQDPYSSLNPRLNVRRLLAEPIRFSGQATGAAIDERVDELLRLVGLPAEAADRYPHEFSGGQRQRIGLARALSVGPQVLIADEPVSALDVSIQAQVINLLVDLQQRLGLTLVFIAHDLAVVRHVSDRVGVMYLGRIVELAAATEIYQRPRHPYTVSLLSAVPVADPEVELSRQQIVLRGDAPSPLNVPFGCRFHERCPIARAEPCSTVEPPLAEIEPGHWTACHFPDEAGALAANATPLNPEGDST
ncbi:dipeptide ABC transporter ATP-binding protein [soil metagenome]